MSHAQIETADYWLREQALPLWLEFGVDRDLGGYFDALDQKHLRNCVPFKRLRVTARQIYVFVEAALHGQTGAIEAVEHGLDFLLTKLRHPAGGFASRCDLEGRIVDDTRDLYDLAFTLFAFAHGYRLTSCATLRSEALALIRFLRAEMRHPAGGYDEALPRRLPRRQNPHMHLLEAALACTEHIGDPEFEEFCHELADLATERFIDADRGLLIEYYSADLMPQRANGRALVEPGHHFEWVWLLSELRRVCGRQVAGGGVLAAFALHHGRDPATGLLRGALYDDGSIATASVRLWPHCEWLKATLVEPQAGASSDAYAVLEQFLATPTTGLWFEQWDAESCRFEAPPAPASSLYHITAALAALGQAI